MKTSRARFENKKPRLKQQFCVWTLLINRCFESNNVYVYTGGILQRLDTDEHSAVTAMVRIVMLQR